MTQAEILALLGEAPENEGNLADLVESMRRRRGVVPFVGAGMSASFGFPQWGEFLRILGTEAARSEHIERRLSAGEHEQAAEDMIQHLGGSRFQDIVERHFGDRVLSAARLRGAVTLLPRLTTGPVITTNFDSVLERVFQDADRPFNRVVWHDKVNSAVRALRNEERVLLKIHGSWDDPNYRVLTRDEYRRYYGDPAGGVDFNLPLPQLFLLLVTRPLLFLGCSLRQDRTVAIIASLTKKIADFRHFAVLEMPDAARLEQRRRELADWNLRPIWYRAGTHDTVAPLLEYLAEQAPATVETSTSAPCEASRQEAFVGRLAEKEELRRLIATHALVTVAGSAGSGKTRLVAEVARSMAGEFKAIWLVPMPVQGAAVEQRVAHILRLPGAPQRSLGELIVEGLEHGRQLLVLDNCEPVLPECLTLVKAVLNGCRELRVVVTSRAVLNEPREVVYWIPPMRSPALGDALRVRELQEMDSVRLLAARVQARMSFALTEDNAEAVAELCGRLEGIPLAIELAAAQLCVAGFKEVLQLFCRRLDLWKDDRAEEGDRGYRTLREAIQISVDLLGRHPTGEKARTLFRRLSVFRHGFTRTAAAAVCGDAEQTDDEVLSLLRVLQDQSLLQSEEVSGERRFRYVDSIREFAAGELIKEETDILSEKHARWFAALAQEASPELLKDQQEHWLRRLTAEADNLRAAIEWAVGRVDAELALRLTGSLWRVMEIKGFYAEGARRLRVALAMPGSKGFPGLRSKALSGLSVLAYRMGRLELAEQASTESLEIERRLANPGGVANALNDLGNVAQMRGRYEAAHGLYLQSLAMQRQAGDRRGVAVALYNMGTQARRLGHLREARGSLEESLEAFQSLGDLREVAFPMNGLAVLAHIERHPRKALQLARRGLDIRSKLTDRKGMAESLRTLAMVHIDQHDLDKARDAAIQSAELAIAIRDDHSVAETLEVLAVLAAAGEQFDQAVSLYATAERARKDLQLPLGPRDLAERDRQLARASTALSPEHYEEWWEAGRWSQPVEVLQRLVRDAEPRNERPGATPAPGVWRVPAEPVSVGGAKGGDAGRLPRLRADLERRDGHGGGGPPLL